MVHKPSFILIGGAPVVEDTIKGIRVSSLSTNDMTVHPLSFIRATDGWRTNKDGNIQRVPFNLLKDSQSMGTSAEWLHNSSNVTITNNSGIAPDGTNTAVKVENLQSNVAVYSEQKIIASAQNTIVLTEGQFNYSVYAKAGGTGDCYLIITLRAVLNNATNEVVSFYFNLNTGAPGQLVHSNLPNCNGLSLNAGNGWYRVGIIGDIPITVSNEIHCSFEFSSAAPPTYNSLYRVTNSTAGTIGYVWGAQLSEKKGTLTNTSNPYIATTDRNDFARIDYSGSCPGILIEPARTNYVKYSQYFLNSIWEKGGCSVSQFLITGPDGNTGRYLIDATASNNYMRQTISQTISDNTYYTISVYVQKGQTSPSDLRFVLSNGAAFFVLTINLSVATPTVSSTGPSSQYTDRSARIYSVGGGWYRVVGTAKVITGGTGFTLGFGSHTNIDDYICYGLQIEEGRYETSYIKTGSDVLLRGSETIEDSNIFSTYSLGNQTDGTVYMEVSYTYPITAHLSLIFELSNSSGDYIAMYRNGSSLSVDVYMNGAFTYSVSVTGMAADNKIALGYSNSYFVVYLNGQQKILSNDVSVPFWDKLSLAKGLSTPDARMIKSFAMYEDILRNEVLQTMTTI